MPVRNCARTVPLAVRSLLAQTCTDWELLLIDDGSTDDTLWEVRHIADPRIHIHTDGTNRGLPARLNQAVALSRGAFFARMDGDDISYPQRLERQLAYLSAHPEVDLVGAQVVVFDATGTALGKPLLPEAHSAICARAFLDVLPMRHPTWLGRTAWFRAHRYDEHAVKTQDQILLLRTYRTSRFANVPEILLGYREERLYLRKMLLTRQVAVPFMFRELLRRGQPALATRAVARQLVKAIVEVMAVQTGLNYRLLGHRLGSLTDAELQAWAQVWDAY
jgi:glycosyltransferase involved in cell wall biosynthesis